MEAEEMAQVGANLLEIGTKLQRLRGEREVLDEQIKQLEKEAQPLLEKQQRYTAELFGNPPSPAPAAAGPAPALQSPTSSTALRQRVAAKLEHMPDGVGPQEVADALSLDVNVVRQAMREMSMASMKKPSPPEPADS